MKMPAFSKLSFENKLQALEIYQEFIDYVHASSPYDLAAALDRFLKNQDGQLSLMYIEDELVGFTEFRDMPLKVRDNKQKVEVTSLFVRPAHQGKGLGKALVEHIKQYALENDRDRIVLYSGLELEEAHKFYEKVGFKKKAFFFELKLA